MPLNCLLNKVKTSMSRIDDLPTPLLPRINDIFFKFLKFIKLFSPKQNKLDHD